jgi:hypothetical protein
MKHVGTAKPGSAVAGSRTNDLPPLPSPTAPRLDDPADLSRPRRPRRRLHNLNRARPCADGALSQVPGVRA